MSKRILGIAFLLISSPLLAQDFPATATLPSAIQKLIGELPPMTNPIHIGRNGYKARRTLMMHMEAEAAGETGFSFRVENESEERVEFKGDRLFFAENLVSSRVIGEGNTRVEANLPQTPITIELAGGAERLYEIKDYSVPTGTMGTQLQEALGQLASDGDTSAAKQRYLTMQYVSPNLSIYFVPGITKSGFTGGYPGGAVPALLMKLISSASGEGNKPQSIPPLLASWKAEGTKDGALIATAFSNATNDEGTVQIDLVGYRFIDIETGRIAEEDVTLNFKLQGLGSKSGRFTVHLRSTSRPS